MKITNIFYDMQVSKQVVKPVAKQVVDLKAEEPIQIPKEDIQESVSKIIKGVPNNVSKKKKKRKA